MQAMRHRFAILAVLVLAALALALFGAVTLIERLTIPWARRVE